MYNPTPSVHKMKEKKLPNFLSFSQAAFEVLPSVIEVQLECFQYWIIVVSFVAGLLALFILIGALALVRHHVRIMWWSHDVMWSLPLQCGVFGRWYKRRGDESLGSSAETVDGGPYRSRSSATYAPRTIPPLSGMEWSHASNVLITLCTSNVILLVLSPLPRKIYTLPQKPCVQNKWTASTTTNSIEWCVHE